MEKKSMPTDTWGKKVRHKLSSVSKLISFPFKVIWLPVRIGNWLRRHWKSAVIVVVFAIGLAMMLGASIRLRGVELVTVLIVAGILIVAAFAKMLYDFVNGMAKRELESETLKEEKYELAEEVARLMTELQQERSGGFRVGIKPILEMGLLEAECEVTEFFDRYFGKDNKDIKDIREGTLEQIGPGPHKKPVKRFVGALSAKFKARYGIDIQKVQVKRDDQAKAMYVAGAEPSFLGVRGYPQMRWEGSVGLHYWWGAWSIDEDSQKLESECKEKYRVALEDRLKNGPEQLNWVKEPLRKAIKRLLQILAPQDYRVEMVKHPGEGFIPLSEYLSPLGLEGPDKLLLP